MHNWKFLAIAPNSVAEAMDAKIAERFGSDQAGTFSARLSANGEEPHTHMLANSHVGDSQLSVIIGFICDQLSLTMPWDEVSKMSWGEMHIDEKLRWIRMQTPTIEAGFGGGVLRFKYLGVIGDYNLGHEITEAGLQIVSPQEI